MIKFLYRVYWRICRMVGYRITFRDYYDPKTFTLKKKNSHMALIKYIGEEDEHGCIRIEEIWQIQIRKI